jgi:hypothetical protein
MRMDAPNGDDAGAPVEAGACFQTGMGKKMPKGN